MQAVQDQLASNQSNYISGLERKQRVEDQNRDEVFNFNERQRRRVFDDEMRVLQRQQGIDPGSRIGDLEALAQFSKTVAEVTADIGKRQSENAMWDEYSKTYEFGLPIDRLEAQEAGYQALAETDERIQTVADRMQANGAPPEAVMSLRKVSGSRAVGQARALAEMAAMHYGPWLEKQFSQDNRTQIELNGETFTPAEVANDPVKRAAATSVLWKNYLTGNNLVGLSPALLAPAFKQMKMAEQQQLAEARTAYAIAGSEQMLDEAKAAAIPAFKTNPGQAFTTLVQSYARSLDQRGQPLGFTAGRQKAMDYLRLAIDTNDVTLETLDAIEDFPTPHQPNRTWGQLYGPELRKLREEVENNYIEDSRRQDSVLQQDGKRWADDVLKEISDNPQSEETLKRLVKYSLDTFGFVDDRLQYYVNNYSTEKIEAERLNDEFEKLAQANRLTLDMVTDPRVPFAVRQQWQNIAKQQSDARAQTGDFKVANEAIENAILAASQYNSATGDPKHYTIPLAIAEAKARFNSIVSTLIQSGKATPDQAAQQALQQVITDIGDGTSGRFEYSRTDQRGFVNIGFDGYGSTRQSVNDATKHLDAIKAKFAGGGGVASLDRFALIPRNTLEAINKQRNSPNVQPPAVANYISELLGGRVSSFEVLNRQLVAQGFDPLPTPEPLQQVERVISPELRRLLLYKPSPRRSMRAYAGIGNYNPALVPKGYGQLIAEVASSNGVDPGLLAGLVQVESNFNPNAVSRAGATGLGQLMPGTAAGLGVRNIRDPRENLQGAARYLRQMLDQFGGELTSGLRAYNQGPDNQQRYPNGVSDEARSYPTKVLRAAASFGFNPNGGSVWRNTATMRPKLVYRIDSIGPTSTGPHLDVKDTQGGMFGRYDLDKYIEVEVGGSRKPLSTVITDDQAAHRRRGSHGIDFAYPKGTPVFLKNGAQVISNSPTEHGDKLVIQLPDGRTFSFLHGRKV
jgi:murein DD-endopeptidase MepM/ murein hydrolase activator NlpD